MIAKWQMQMALTYDQFICYFIAVNLDEVLEFLHITHH